MKFDLPKIGWNINPSDPFEFKCDKCEKTHIFTEDEIEKVKVKTPNTSNDYHIICQFCKKWIMEPPVFIQSSWFF